MGRGEREWEEEGEEKGEEENGEGEEEEKGEKERVGEDMEKKSDSVQNVAGVIKV